MVSIRVIIIELIFLPLDLLYILLGYNWFERSRVVFNYSQSTTTLHLVRRRNPFIVFPPSLSPSFRPDMIISRFFMDPPPKIPPSPLKAFSRVLCTYTRMEQIDYVALPYLVPRETIHESLVNLAKCSACRCSFWRAPLNVMSRRHPIPPFRHNEIHVLPKYKVDPSCSLKFRGFVVALLPRHFPLSNLTFAFSSWLLPMRQFVLIVLPLKQFPSRIRICTPFLWSMPTFLNPQSIVLTVRKINSA